MKILIKAFFCLARTCLKLFERISAALSRMIIETQKQKPVQIRNLMSLRAWSHFLVEVTQDAARGTMPSTFRVHTTEMIMFVRLNWVSA